MKYGAEYKPAIIRGARIAAPLFCLAMICILWACWMIRRANRALQEDILEETRLLAETIDPKQVQALNSPQDGLRETARQNLLRQFTAHCAVCREHFSAWLATPRSESLTSEAPKDFLLFFMSYDPRQPRASFWGRMIKCKLLADAGLNLKIGEGVVRRYAHPQKGTVFQVVVPLDHTGDEHLPGILGLELVMTGWHCRMAIAVLLPGSVVLLFITGLIALVACKGPVEAESKSVLRLLFPTLLGMVLLLSLVVAMLYWHQHRRHLQQTVNRKVDRVHTSIKSAINDRVSGMSAALTPLTFDAEARQALRENNAAALAAAWQPLFEAWHEKHEIAYLCFFDANRAPLQCFSPARHSVDMAGRSILPRTEYTGHPKYSLDIAASGVIILRVRHPIIDRDGELLGYVEMGEDCQRLIEETSMELQVFLAVAIDKKLLHHQQWTAAGKVRNDSFDWHRFDGVALVHASQKKLPEAFSATVENYLRQDPTSHQLRTGTRKWHLSATNLRDRNDAGIGRLLIIMDVSEEDTAFWRTLTLGGFGGGLLTVMFLVSVYALLYREEHKKRSALLEHKERLRSLAAKLATAQDQEQRRIAEGLHGEVAQLLAAVSMRLASARSCHSPKKVAEIYDQIDELLDHACQKVRSLSFELTSSTLYRLGLYYGIVELCEIMNQRHNMCFTVQGEVQKDLVDENSATIVFKAVREMLFNVLKHAGVREARVKIECEKEMLKVSVIDRGKGFPGGGPADHSLNHKLGSGMGLFGIHQRIQDLGGKMAVYSQPDVETRVVLRVPTRQ